MRIIEVPLSNLLPSCLLSLHSLEVLRLESATTLGVCIDDVWGQVDELQLHVPEALLGVPVEGTGGGRV